MPDPYNPWATPIFPGDNAQQPYESYASPQIANILTHIAGALGRGFMAPGNALNSPTPLTSEQLVQPAHDMMGVMVGGVPMAERGAVGVMGGKLGQGPKEYPMAPRSEWYGDANYANTGGQIAHMTPDEFLSKARPLKIDEMSRENIDILKQHMQDGKTLDPLALYANGKEDGRHRAYAAKELGINTVPVLMWPNK